MINTFSLSGKRIIVTGASSGIGRACAIACSSMGAQTLIFGRDRERLEQTLLELSPFETTLTHSYYLADLTDSNKVESIVNEIRETQGPIDGIIHCAGISTILPVKAVSKMKMDSFFSTNVFAPYQFTRVVLKSGVFNSEGGSIIFLTSVMGSVGEVGRSLYGMTKSSLIGATKSLAIELAPKRIRVNCISPGVVVSPMSDRSIYSQDQESRDKIIALHPLGLGLPQDVSAAAIFLLSPASRWITGTNLIVDGGYTSR